MNKLSLLALIFIIIASVFVFTVCKTGGKRGSAVSPGAPLFITSNFAQDSSTGFVVQWHDLTGVKKQIVQVVKEDQDFSSANEITVTGELFDVTGITACPNTSNKCNNPVCTGYGNYEVRRIFRTEVTDLEPNTKYKYRVGAPNAWSKEYTHLTSSGTAADFSFTVITDSQDSVFTGTRTTLNAANSYDPNHRFFLHAGDVVDYIGLNKTEIENYSRVASEFNITKPIAATQGNHDTYHNKKGDQYVFGEATVFNAFTVFPNNGFVRSQPNWDKNRSDSYYFYYNRVLIIMLNTMATQNTTGTNEPNHTAQAEWFRQILQNDKVNNLSDFRIVVTHVPPFAGRGSSNEREPWLMEPVRAAYAPICTEFNVDILFAGHDHVYTRSNSIKITAGQNSLEAIQTANPGRGNIFGPTSGGTIYTIVGATGPKLYAFRDPEFANNVNAYIPKVYPVRFDQNGGTGTGNISPGTFVNVKVTGNKMTVTAMRVNQTTPLDVYEVTKK